MCLAHLVRSTSLRSFACPSFLLFFSRHLFSVSRYHPYYFATRKLTLVNFKPRRSRSILVVNGCLIHKLVLPFPHYTLPPSRPRSPLLCILIAPILYYLVLAPCPRSTNFASSFYTQSSLRDSTLTCVKPSRRRNTFEAMFIKSLLLSTLAVASLATGTFALLLTRSFVD